MLDQFTTLLENVSDTLARFQEMRDAISDDEWDKFCDHKFIGPLLDSLTELESTIDE